MDYRVVHFVEQSRFEIVEDNKKAYLEYEVQGDRMNILHTVVPPELEGRGIGSTLMREALRYASEKQLEAFPICSFAVSYLSRLPQEHGN